MAKAKKLPSGTWRALVYDYTDATGKRHYESFTADTAKEANYLAAEYALKKKSKSKPANMTVAEAIDNYIEIKENVLSPSTIASYKKIKRNNLQSLLNIKLSKLTQEDVQREINTEAKTLSPKTVTCTHGLLSSVLKEFYPDFVLRTKLPQKEKYMPSIPSTEDIEKIMACIVGEEIELPVLMALWLGMRMSEIRGLKWENVKEDYILIKEAIVDADNVAVLKGTKSFAGTRKIMLPGYIKTLIERQPKNTEFVVPLTGQTIYKRFIRMLEKNEIPHCRFHDLRHANASVMLRLNVPDKYAMERLGHAQNSTLKMIYQHTMVDESQKVSDSVNEYFEKMQHEMQHGNKKSLENQGF